MHGGKHGDHLQARVTMNPAIPYLAAVILENTRMLEQLEQLMADTRAAEDRYLLAREELWAKLREIRAEIDRLIGDG